MSEGTYVGHNTGPMPGWMFDRAGESWDDDDFLDEDEDCDLPNKKETTMSKDYMTSRGYAYATEAEAIADAKKYTAKNFDDVKIYKAYKLVSTATPNVDVADYSIPATA